MIDDPYKVLGVSPNATDEEVKNAYRRMAKKYHPDLHPGDAEAARKMNEVNAAYDQIKNPNKQPGYSSYGGYRSYGNSGGSAGQYRNDGPFGGFGDFTWFWQQASGGDIEYQNARYYIMNGRYTEALAILQQVETTQRRAKWYYFSSLANYGVGNKLLAMEHIRQASQMEPNNIEYQQTAQRMQNGSHTYRQEGGGVHTVTAGPGKLCLGLCFAQLFCRFCPFCWWC